MTHAPLFHTSAGSIEGWRDGDLIRATGIPYATASRFSPPVPVLSLEGAAPYPGMAPSAPGEPFRAREFSPCAPQCDDPNLENLFGLQRRDLGMSEDCLRLSIVRPADVAEGERLPVMVWIHGGSYVSGCGDSSITDPADLVREQRVLVVTVTYRMGILGFLSSRHSPGNLGLMDQREAFRWVRRNIAAFGGDPGNVTAFGESAGADSIAHLMAAMGAEMGAERGADGVQAGTALLFNRALLMSPPLGIRKNRSRMNRAMSTFVDPLVHEGASAQELVALQVKAAKKVGLYGLPGMMPFGTEYGEAPLPAEGKVEDAWRRIAPLIPVLIGTLGTESSMFAHTMPAAQAVLKAPRVGERAYWSLVALTSDIVFEKPAREFAELWRHAGGQVQRYEIPWSVPGNSMRSPHALDVALMFARRDTWQEVVPLRGSSWAKVREAGAELRRYFGEFGSGESLSPRTRMPEVIRSV